MTFQAQLAVEVHLVNAGHAGRVGMQTLEFGRMPGICFPVFADPSNWCSVDTKSKGGPDLRIRCAVSGGKP